MSLPALGQGATFNLREDLELAAELPENSFRLLLRAARYAQSTHQPAKDFAVTLGELQASGLAECDLRWLAHKGFVAHAPLGLAVAGNGALQSFNERSSFLLTPRGQQFVECLLADAVAGAGGLAAAASGQHVHPVARAVPRWDLQRRVLSLGRVIVKQFCVPAENQEIILSSFQEEAWPERLDDPLPPAGIDAKRRLHSAIQCLNRNQRARLLRFHGDGYGRGIRWEPRLAGQSKNPRLFWASPAASVRK